jgi:hypothetical protein
MPGFNVSTTRITWGKTALLEGAGLTLTANSHKSRLVRIRNNSFTSRSMGRCYGTTPTATYFKILPTCTPKSFGPNSHWNDTMAELLRIVPLTSVAQ